MTKTPVTDRIVAALDVGQEPHPLDYFASWEERTGFPFTPQGIADWIDAEVLRKWTAGEFDPPTKE